MAEPSLPLRNACIDTGTRLPDQRKRDAWEVREESRREVE